MNGCPYCGGEHFTRNWFESAVFGITPSKPTNECLGCKKWSMYDEETDTQVEWPLSQ